MKRLTSFVVALILATTALWAYNFQSGDLYYNITSSTEPYTVGVASQESYSSDNYKGLTSITIPSTVTYDGTTYSVTSIGTSAFRGCTSLTSITISNSVISIGDGAFYGCTGLTSMVIESGNKIYDSRDNCNAIIETATNTLTHGCKTTVIPNSVTSIGEYAFYYVPNVVYNGTATGSPWGAKSVNGYVDGYWVYADAGKTTLLACSVATGTITIPNGVTSIGNFAFSSCTGLTSITIPESVTSIGRCAFSGCTGLTSITIPNSVTFIGDRAFGNCWNLISATLGDNVTSIEERLFQQCYSLTSVTIGRSVRSIGYRAFSGCESILSVIIPDSVISITDEAFQNCKGLKSVIIGNSVKSIGNKTFRGCTSLTTLTIPNSVTSIDDYAFYGCTGLTTVTLGSSVTSIGTSAFRGCTSLTSITISNSVTSIGSNAFYGCTGLTSITIPNSVTSIGEYAFCGCTGLTSITIPNSVTSIGMSAFRSCTGLFSVIIPNSVSSIGENAFSDVRHIAYNGTATGSPWGAQYMNGLEEGYLIYDNAKRTTILACNPAATGAITIPNSVTGIGAYAFACCTGLASITIPNSVMSIGDLAFWGCTSLTSITIPNSITSIGWSAFEGCAYLISITIPESVTSIGGNAFCNTAWFYNQPDGVVYINKVLYKYKGTMPKGTSIAIKEGTISISDCAFYASFDCDNNFDDRAGLTSITIPNSVTSIGAYAFSDCTSLTSVTIPNSVTSIGDGAFDGCTGLTSITIPNSVEIIGEDAFYNCSGLTSITIPNSVTSIGESAFKGVLNIVYNGTATGSPWGAKSVNGYVDGYLVYTDATKTTLLACSSAATGTISIPNSVTSIGYRAFYGCFGLTSITIPESVTNMGNQAFSECWQLTSIVWNAKHCNGWSNYYDSPFYNIRDNITSFSFGDEVDTIPYAICDNMQNLRSITIPASVRSIGGSAFYGCSGLTSVTIPENVTSIGNYAFRGCTGLKSIRVDAQIPPQCGDNSSYHVFYNVPTDIPIYIPCGTKEAYQAAAIWSSFTNYIEIPSYSLTVMAQNETMGSVRITQEATCSDNTAVFEATANDGYHFTQWSDGNTDNPRSMILECDASFRAIFAPNQYTISTSAENGQVEGAGIYDYGTTATLTAVANEHYHFTQWSDGNTDNPRTVSVDGNATYTAEFAVNQYTITVNCEALYGVVFGGGTYSFGSQVTLGAIANKGYEFTKWSNGVTNNPYQFTAAEDLTLEAEFIPTTAIDDIQADTDITPQKVFIDGQVYILRNNKTYTTTGLEVK